MKIFFNKLHYNEKPNLFEKALVSILTPASFAYSCASELRTLLYKIGVLKSYRPSVFTLAVGNLTTGGTGKTPITSVLANFLSEKGYKVGILSRGYGSKLNPKDINIISDGNKVFFEDGTIAGDEPFWLAKNCPNCAVLTSADRVKIAKYAEKILGCTALVLDDGFQHIKLERDLNICVADSRKLFGNKKSLPAGPLREPIKHLNRADKIIIVSKADAENLASAKEKIQNLTQKPIIVCEMISDRIYELNSKEDLIPGSKVIAFSAIGQPEQFYNFLKNKCDVIATFDFEDHHSYTVDEINSLAETARKKGAKLVTTEKDGVKLKNLTQNTIYVLHLTPKLNVNEVLD